MRFYLSDCTVLNERPNLRERYLNILTSEEKEILQNKKSDWHRDQFLMGRAMIRDICGQSPKISSTGKILISNGYISLAHSGRYVVLAVADTPVGIDIEDTAKDRDFDALAGRMGWILGQDKRLDFYKAFTRYEARYKLGENQGDFQDIYYSIKTFIICINKLNNKEKIYLYYLIPFKEKTQISLDRVEA